MSAERRLAKIESGLSPTELVLRWLAEAHRHEDFTAYTRWLIDTDPSGYPMDRLAREAQTSAREQNRGLPREEADWAIRKAIAEALVRVQLVLRINVTTDETIDREALILAALSAHAGLAIAARDGKEIGKGGIAIPTIRDLLLGRVTELHAAEAARVAVEKRYFAGTSVLFPAALRAWSEQETRSEQMASIAVRLAELDAAKPPIADDSAAFDARIAQIVADYIEPARSRAYDEMGDGRRAMTLAIRWLRPKVAKSDAVPAGLG